MHVRHPSYRLVTRAGVPFPSDVNTEIREDVDRDGYSLFRIGLSLADIPRS